MACKKKRKFYVFGFASDRSVGYALSKGFASLKSAQNHAALMHKRGYNTELALSEGLSQPHPSVEMIKKKR